ncbi:MAG: hypothetical protein ACTSWX_10165, partial [Promethearchaeota archaeon]
MMKNQYIYPKFQNIKKEDLILSKPQNVNSKKNISLEKISHFLEGKGLCKDYIDYFILFLLIFLFTLTIPALLFPTHYAIPEYFISAMGNYSKNPIGAYFFNGGMIVLGIMQIPLQIFLAQKLRKESENLALTSGILGIIASMGYIMVGFFPENIWVPHIIGASLVFIGFFIVANIDLLILMQIRKQDEEFKKKSSSMELVYFIIYAVGAQFLFVTILNRYFPDSTLLDIAIFSPSLWEWTYMFALNLWLI